MSTARYCEKLIYEKATKFNIWAGQEGVDTEAIFRREELSIYLIAMEPALML